MPSKKKLYIILFSTVAFLILAGFVWSLIVTRDLRNPDGKKSGISQVATVKNIVVTETKDGKVYWELYAEKGSYDSDKGGVLLTNVLGNFYNPDDEVVISFRSDNGTYSEETKEISIGGNALVVAYDGSSIRADKLTFKGKDEDILAEGNVIINRNDDFITHSQKARFNTSLTFFEISGKTETNVYTKDNSKVQKLIK